MANTNGTIPVESGEASWEHKTLERLAFAALEEQRRERKWKIFRLLFIFILLPLFYVSLLLLPRLGQKPLASRYTALVELQGAIAPDALASADNIVAGLRAAFEDTSTAGVILRVNSPGGSPVQSNYIYSEIRRLREKYPKTPLYAVVTDICASGCYYAAAAADKIYVSPGSLVGSIGVLMNGFGFTEVMKKVGVERRLLTAGEHKGILDPFSPVKPEELRHAQRQLDAIHRQFIQAVRDGRGEALKETKDMFSGLFWTGDKAIDLGLVDDFGSASFVAREVIKAEEIVDFTFRENVLDRFARRIGTSMADSMSLRLFDPTLR